MKANPPLHVAFIFPCANMTIPGIRCKVHITVFSWNRLKPIIVGRHRGQETIYAPSTGETMSPDRFRITGPRCRGQEWMHSEPALSVAYVTKRSATEDMIFKVLCKLTATPHTRLHRLNGSTFCKTNVNVTFHMKIMIDFTDPARSAGCSLLLKGNLINWN